MKQVQKIVNKNKQYREHYISLFSEFNTTGVLTEITAIGEAAGTDWYGREANTIQVKHLTITGDYYNNDATATLNRLMVVRSKVGPLALADMPAYNAQADLSKMEVMYDKPFAANPGATDGVRIPLINYKHSFKTGKIPHLNVGYVDATSATAAQKNPLYIYLIGSTAAASTDNAIFGHIKLNYFDKGQ